MDESNEPPAESFSATTKSTNPKSAIKTSSSPAAPPAAGPRASYRNPYALPLIPAQQAAKKKQSQRKPQPQPLGKEKAEQADADEGPVNGLLQDQIISRVFEILQETPLKQQSPSLPRNSRPASANRWLAVPAEPTHDSLAPPESAASARPSLFQSSTSNVVPEDSAILESPPLVGSPSNQAYRRPSLLQVDSGPNAANWNRFNKKLSIVSGMASKTRKNSTAEKNPLDLPVDIRLSLLDAAMPVLERSVQLYASEVGEKSALTQKARMRLTALQAVRTSMKMQNENEETSSISPRRRERVRSSVGIPEPFDGSLPVMSED